MGEVTSPAPAVASRRPDAFAGALGAAASLVTLEVVALFDATGTSVTEAVGNRFLESFAASLKEVAVILFGTNDKAALQIGTAVIAVGIGAFLGSKVARRPNLVLGGFASFGLVGIVASAADPQASLALAVVGCVVAALVGGVVTIGLHRRWAGISTAAKSDQIAGSALARRTVLVNGGVTAVALLFTTLVARSVRDSLRTTASTVRRVLPRATPKIDVPTATLDTGARAVEGISPFVTPTDDFYRIDTALRVPIVDVDSWTLKITGMVDRELEFTYDDLLARDLIEVPITMLCVSNVVGGDLVGTARWIGVPLKELLEEAGVQAGAEQVMGESVDEFTAGFPVEAALDGRDALLVVGMNDAPLPAEHGFPARLVVPGIYGYVSATKWIKEIRLTTWDEQGFWVPRGWSRLGPIKTSSRIDVPATSSVAVGEQAVAGVAWAPTKGIRSVEVQVDDEPWVEAQLGPTASDDTWVQWWYRWDAPKGPHTLRARATDGDGVTQTAERSRPDPNGATGHHQIEVEVT